MNKRSLIQGVSFAGGVVVLVIALFAAEAHWVTSSAYAIDAEQNAKAHLILERHANEVYLHQLTAKWIAAAEDPARQAEIQAQINQVEERNRAINAALYQQ